MHSHRYSQCWLLLFLLGCAWHPLPAQSFKRHYATVQWDSVSTIEAGDSIVRLYNPLSLAGYGDSVAVVDYGDNTVKCFTKNGQLIGSFGRRGRGPWEVNGLTSVVLGADGNLWVGDRGNSRAYALTRRCEPHAQVYLPTTPHRVFAGLSGAILAIGSLDSVPRLVDSARRVTTAALPAIPSALQADPIVRTSLDVVVIPRVGFAISYLYASWIALYDRLGAVSAIPAPDGQPFPPLRRWKVGSGVARVGPDPSSKRISNGIATDGQYLFVLSPGLTDDDREAGLRDSDYGDAIDVYSIADRHYLESWRLPRAVRALSWSAGYMMLLSRDPEPAITFWRYRREHG